MLTEISPAAGPDEYLAAVVQAAPVFCDLPRSVDKAISIIADASRRGASIVAFPELYLPGYPWWIWLDNPMTAARKGFSARYRASALSYDDPLFTALCDAARQHAIMVSVSFAEKDGGTLYVSECVIDARGVPVLKRRKMKPGAPERAVFGEGDVSDLQVSATKLGRIGSLSCGEHRHPLLKYALYSQDEDLHIAAWPSFSVYQPAAVGQGYDVNTCLSRLHAIEGACHVLAPSSVVSEEMIDMLCDTDASRQLLSSGGGYARAYDPEGRSLGEILEPHEEGLLLVPIRHGIREAAKANFDVLGHSSRPDVIAALAQSFYRHSVARRTLPHSPVVARISDCVDVIEETATS